MRSNLDDKTARQIVEPALKNAGFETISFRGIGEGDYWIHVRKEVSQ